MCPDGRSRPSEVSRPSHEIKDQKNEVTRKKILNPSTLSFSSYSVESET